MDVYVRLTDAPVRRTVELVDELGGMVLDYAEDGSVVGIEVLGAIGVEVDGAPVERLGP